MRETAIITRAGRNMMLVPENEAERLHGMNSGAPHPYVGMVFNFRPLTTPVMTMAQTPQPLQIAFVGADRLVHTIWNAEAFSGLYTTTRPTRWVIETPALWQILRVGDRIVFSV